MKAFSYKRMMSFMAVVYAALMMLAMNAFAHSIDYVANTISPAASFSGNSGNFTLNNDVNGGADITFTLTFQINTQGNTTQYPKTVTFGVTDITKPSGATDPTVLFGANPGAATTNCIFTSATTTCVVGVTVNAPLTAGAYSVKIDAIDGTGGRFGLEKGGGIVVGFTVKQAVTSCDPKTTTLSLTLSPACIVVGAHSSVFTAYLSSENNPLSGRAIDFNLDTFYQATQYSDSSGNAVLNSDPSQLKVGNHTVQASFQGEQCYNGSGSSATLGVTYDFKGFLPPVQIDGNGVGLFAGKVIPVKIKIADADGNPVTDAEPHVFFSQTSANPTTEEAADSIASTAPDGGNTMRYDPIADQYVFNWDVSKLDNGYYNIRVGLGEGSCGQPRVATVNLQKKGGKK